MKALLVAAALLAPLPAAAHAQWWVNTTHPEDCIRLEAFVPGQNFHTPSQLIAELAREGTHPTHHNYYGPDGKLFGVQIDMTVPTGTYEVGVFSTLAQCRGFEKVKPPEAVTTPPSDDKSI